jgi:23S rRNA (cytosine1962-C5)-methyltransferase
MASVTLRKTRETRVRGGHPWIYSSEIETVEGEPQYGDIVDVKSWKGTLIGRAFYNPTSQIYIRMLTTRDEACDRAFFKKRIEDAWNYRLKLCDPMSCRAVYSESDYLPGLIVDRYNDLVSIQALTQAMDAEPVRSVIMSELRDRLKPAAIAERVDPRIRELEQLPARPSGLVWAKRAARFSP